MAAAKVAATPRQQRFHVVGAPARWLVRGPIFLSLLPLATSAISGGKRWSELAADATPSHAELQLRGRRESGANGGHLPDLSKDASTPEKKDATVPEKEAGQDSAAKDLAAPLAVGAQQSAATEGEDQDPEEGQDIAGDMARALWGSSKWPPVGEPGWPPLVTEASAVGEIEERKLLSCLEMSFIMMMVLCFAVLVTLRSRETAAVMAAAAKAPAVGGAPSPPAAPEETGAPAASPPIAGGDVAAPAGPAPVAAPDFSSQFSALACAICWRHLHRRALVVHLLRFSLPVLSLVLMTYMRDVLVAEFAKPEWEAVFARIGVRGPEQAVDAILEYTFAVMLLYLALTSLTNFVWHLATESETGLRRLFHVSGLSRAAYLTATGGVDGVLQTLVSMGIMVLIAQVVLRLRLVVWTSPAMMLLVLLLLASTATLLGYLIHFPFQTARSANTAAQILVMVVTFTAPLTPLNSVVPLRKTGQSWKTLALPTLPAFDTLFELARGCAKGRCLVFADLAPAFVSKEWVYPTSMIFGVDKAIDPTPPVAILCYLGLLLVQLALGWSLVALLDARRHPALHKAVQKPPTEVERSEGGVLPVLEVSQLVHCYGWLPAVAGEVAPGSQDRVLNGVSFSAAAGATMGLLGPNGAGKTTAIRCITGEEKPTAGTVSIRPLAVGGGVDGGPATIGLCPQETVLNEDLTVSENLLLFARVRGLSGEGAAAAVIQILRATRLQEKHDWMPNTLSGGMRRRLCVACAMVGSPAVVILDEPTTGLDPLSRRGIWGTVGEIKVAGGCCMLTTHMLEEAEALCTSLVILRRGTIAAEGSVQQLKEEWGTGYVLNMDSNPGDEERAKQCVAALLPEGCKEPVKASSQGQLTFKVPGDAHTVGRLFMQLAEAAEANGVRRWGISQASLEDAYLRIIQEEVPVAAAM